MKQIAFGILAFGVIIGGVLHFVPSTQTVFTERVVEVEKPVEVQPEWASDADAVKAAQDVIRKKELQAELESLDAQIKDLSTKRKEVATELDAY